MWKWQHYCFLLFFFLNIFYRSKLSPWTSTSIWLSWRSQVRAKNRPDRNKEKHCFLSSVWPEFNAWSVVCEHRVRDIASTTTQKLNVVFMTDSDVSIDSRTRGIIAMRDVYCPDALHLRKCKCETRRDTITVSITTFACRYCMSPLSVCVHMCDCRQ